MDETISQKNQDDGGQPHGAVPTTNLRLVAEKAGHSPGVEGVPLLEVRRVSLGARVVCVTDGTLCQAGDRGTVVHPEPQYAPAGYKQMLIQIDDRHRSWYPAAYWNVTYEAGSVASIMRYIFDVFEVAHDDLAKLRRKVVAADEHQHRHAKETQGLVETATIAEVVLSRLEAGRSVGQLLKLSRGKLCKLARARLRDV